MRSFTCLIGLLSVIAALVGVQAIRYPASDLVVLESLPQVPIGWHQDASIPANKRVHFRIAIVQENAFAFEQHVISISSPSHPLYGQHMGREELKSMLQPSPEASKAVLDWLQAEGISRADIEDNGDWINFRVSITDAERILDTKFHYYSNSASHTKRIRTLQYSIPKLLHRYIQMIQPTTRFGEIRPQRFQHTDVSEVPKFDKITPTSMGFNATFCNNTVTPQCIKDLYGFADFKAEVNKGNTFGIAGFLNEYPKFKEYETFVDKYAPYVLDKTFKWVSINGGLLTQNSTGVDDVEGNMDVQFSLPLIYPTKGTYYSTGGKGQLVFDLDQPNITANQNEPYLDFLHYMVALPNDELPTTLTASYGENEQSVPAAYANRTCNLIAQLGARGVSVIFSSGDYGPGMACQTNDGKNTTRFLPTFPASCPFVTSVGGTYLVEPEQAVELSSGGFSDRYPRPSYQDKAVTKYLNNLGNKWEGLYNPAGRGFPDVAAQGNNYTYFDNGKEGLIGGTSASAPTFAAIISLLNGARLSSGKPPLGFLNPFIYEVGYQGLNDIVLGGSGGCTGYDVASGLKTPNVPFAGWNATEGWDPVTGYGTPNFPKLLELSQQYYSGQVYLKAKAAQQGGYGYTPPKSSYGYGHDNQKYGRHGV